MSRYPRPNKTLSMLLLLSLTASLTTGCSTFWKRPKSPPKEIPSEVETNWCYKTLAEIECYPTPQRDAQSRLVGVQPKEITPSTREEYKKTYLQTIEPKKK